MPMLLSAHPVIDDPGAAESDPDQSKNQNKLDFGHRCLRC